MNRYKSILVTGGAGFVGSNVALQLKERHPRTMVTALDNLMRKGSVLNVPRLKKGGVRFIKGDVRRRKDFNMGRRADFVIDCAAEPSVMAGVNSTPEYLVQTNLGGTLNCLEYARANGADIIFLSTSRVYPVAQLNELSYREGPTRYVLSMKQSQAGASGRGIAEDFPLGTTRTLYGATKLASELMLQEYISNYGIKGVINRCGVIAGPWQMGKIDQGVLALWVAHHLFGKPLSYIGFGGHGKQVRDFIHIDDLIDLIDLQIQSLSRFSGETFNVGGGLENSFSLLELTRTCEAVTGNHISISSVRRNRPGDVRIYLTDGTKITTATGWRPRRDLQRTVADVAEWIRRDESRLRFILG